MFWVLKLESEFFLTKILNWYQCETVERACILAKNFLWWFCQSLLDVAGREENGSIWRRISFVGLVPLSLQGIFCGTIRPFFAIWKIGLCFLAKLKIVGKFYDPIWSFVYFKNWSEKGWLGLRYDTVGWPLKLFWNYFQTDRSHKFA